MPNAINPYYSPESLGLEMISFDQPGLSYEYNTLCFWATNDGRVFYAQDEGCSCPTPFDEYSGETQKDVIQKLGQVGSADQAVRTAKSWGHCEQDDYVSLRTWVNNKLKLPPEYQI